VLADELLAANAATTEGRGRAHAAPRCGASVAERHTRLNGEAEQRATRAVRFRYDDQET
jgi:hypothetical protein